VAKSGVTPFHIYTVHPFP